MRILALFIAMMFLAGCATKAPPPPAPQMIVIPVQLVNYDKRQNLVINEVPDTEDLKKITAESPADYLTH